LFQLPDGTQITPSLLPGKDEGTLSFDFTPKTTGAAKIDVKIAGSPVGNSPSEIFVFPEKILVKPVDPAKKAAEALAQENADAGEGKKKKPFPPKNPCLLVTDDAGEKISEIHDPQPEFTVTVDVKLEDGAGNPLSGFPENFNPDITVTSPAGTKIPSISEFSPKDSELKVSYQPKEEGDHKIEVFDPKNLGTPIAQFISAVEDAEEAKDKVSPPPEFVARGPGVEGKFPILNFRVC
jgi:hypothetical protein